jgi:hypothetical protein
MESAFIESGAERSVMAYHYYTEALFLEEKLLGRTGAHSTEAITGLATRFNDLSNQGWELFHIAEVNVVGKIFKADDRRGVTVAFFRKETPVTSAGAGTSPALPSP